MSEETSNFKPKSIGKIIQLDYDLITSITGECSYCLTDAHVQMILGIMDYFGWRTRWYSASGTIDQQTILDLQGGLTERLMCGCCNDTSILSQWTPNGHYQTSTDGGTTYTDTPGSDPRNAQTVFPPFLPPGTSNATCTYADSVVQFIKTKVLELISDTTTAEEVIGVITSAVGTILTLLSTTIIGGIIVALLGAAALLIAIAGGAAFKAAFTTDVWNRLRCNIQSHIGSDGNFTQAQIDSIYGKIGTDESGLTAIFLQQMVAMMGIQGMENAARAGLGAADADCSCGDGCMSSWTIVAAADLPHAGVEVSKSSSEWIIQASLAGDGRYYVSIQSDAIDNCCKITSNDYTQTDYVLWNCGEAFDSGGHYREDFDTCINKALFSGTVNYQIHINFAGC